MFAKITNGQLDRFPYTAGDLRRDNPNTSFPGQIPMETMVSHGMVEVTQKPAPLHDGTTQYVEFGPVPELENGVWVLQPRVCQLNQDQLADRRESAASAVRGERDALLAATDWAGLSDVIMTPEMTAYRQALRDITLQPGFPHNVLWPTKPGA